MKKFIKKEVFSFKYAINGIKGLFLERHFKVQVIIGLFVVALGFIQQVNKIEWLAIILCIALVLVAEAINTAIEKTVDYISLERNINAKYIKDISAGMVLIASILSATVWCIIFLL